MEDNGRHFHTMDAIFSSVNKEGCIKSYGRGKVVKAPLRIMPK